MALLHNIIVCKAPTRYPEIKQNHRPFWNNSYSHVKTLDLIERLQYFVDDFFLCQIIELVFYL